jgi:hypothetical protein
MPNNHGIKKLQFEKKQEAKAGTAMDQGSMAHERVNLTTNCCAIRCTCPHSKCQYADTNHMEGGGLIDASNERAGTIRGAL